MALPGHTSNVAGFTPQGTHLSLDGTNEYLESTASAVVGLTDAQTISIGIWFRPQTTIGVNEIRTLFDLKESATLNNRVEIRKFSVNTLRVILNNSSGSTTALLDLASGMANNVWSFVLLVKFGSGVGDTDAWLDDVAFSIPFDSGVSTTDSSRDITIGAVNGGASQLWQGDIYQTMIWDADVTAARTALYNGGAPAGLDLNTNFGTYTFADQLLYWRRPGLRQSAEDEIGFNFAKNATGDHDLTRNNITIAGDIVAGFPS